MKFGRTTMKILIALVLLAFMGAGKAFAQIPAEWQAAAQAVIGDLERDVSSRASHGNSHLGHGQRRCVIHAVADHGDLCSTLGQAAQFQHLLFR